MDLKKLVESRYAEVITQQDRLTESWKPFIVGVDEYLKEERGYGIGIHESRNLAQCLDNAFMQTTMKSKGHILSEGSTTENDIAFLGIQLPVISALLPSLALNEVALVQALDRRVGGVFFLDVQFGSDKGSIVDGETMISSKTGHTRSLSGRNFASTHVKGEAITGLTTGPDTSQQLLAYSPGVSLANGSVVITDTSYNTVYATNVGGVLVGTNISGTVTAAGVLTVVTETAFDMPSGGLVVSYDYQYDLPTDAYGTRNGVPKAKIQVTMETMTATDYPLRSEYSVGAALDLMKAHGINLEDEIVKYLGNEIRWTIDQVGLNMMDLAARSTGAATAITSWNAKVGTGQEWLWKKHELPDRFEEGNINIIDKTLRAVANFMVVGNNVARVIKQLPTFKPVPNLDKSLPTGPVKIGTLDGRTVVQNPFMDDVYVGSTLVQGKNRYFMGYRGSDYLHAGFIYAPYIPLMTTPTLTTADLMSQKGFLSSAGFKTINQGMFVHGYITGLGTTTVE